MLFQSIGVITKHVSFSLLSLRAAELGAQLVDECHDLRVSLVLGDVGWILSHVLEGCHHFRVLNTQFKMTNDLVFCDRLYRLR